MMRNRVSRAWLASLAAIACGASACSAGFVLGPDASATDTMPRDTRTPDAGGTDGAGVDARAMDAPAQDSARTDGSIADATVAMDAPGEIVVDAGTDTGAPMPDVQPDVVGTTLDLHQVTMFDNPADLADWPVTTQITEVDFQYMGTDGVHVEFSKRDGPNSWPDIMPPGWTGPLEYTLGFAEYIDGHWYASAAIQFWRGLASMGGNVAQDVPSMGQCTSFGHGSSCQVARNWYYDGRWGALAGYQPATGEIIGVFVVAGNLRGVTDGSQSPVHERSNVVLVRMPDLNGAQYTF